MELYIFLVHQMVMFLLIKIPLNYIISIMDIDVGPWNISVGEVPVHKLENLNTHLQHLRKSQMWPCMSGNLLMER